MLNAVIRYSLHYRFLILLLSALLTVWGILSFSSIKLDAIPDISDVQVVIRINYPGQTPEQIENQVTFPLTSSLMSISEARDVRAYSMSGDAYIYTLFEDGTNYDWARARVLEYVNQITPKLPDGAEVLIGPEASGVSWIYQYALTDDGTGNNSLGDLRAIQDWYLKFELQSVDGVAEVAAIGGMVKQFQIVIDPDKQRHLGISLSIIEQAIHANNQESSGSVIELGEAEYAVHSNGYISSIEDLELISVGQNPFNQTPILLRDIAQIRLGPQMRRGVAELDGQGEVVGGIIVMRAGENPLDVIQRVKKKLAELQPGLPQGVKVVSTYDRSQLILSAVSELVEKLWQEVLAVMLVCLLFLWHLRSAVVAVVSLPLGILVAFIVMSQQGITANIMSLGGVAIAIGAMVDAAIVMIENMHQHLHVWYQKNKQKPSSVQHWDIVFKASCEVGPALFYSLLIVSLSFLPVLLLEGEEGKMFSSLAYTKTYAMAAAAGLAVTLIPVLMGYFIRGNFGQKRENPLMRFLERCYCPLLHWSLKHPVMLSVICLALLLSSLYPLYDTRHEFMPELDEGDLLYMPTTLPGLPIGKAQQLLQQTDQIIKSVPEVAQVFGKAGRAETATDPSPLTMFETTIRLKPKEQWREGLSLQDLIKELDEKVSLPGISNAWGYPVRTRIDMLSTGIKTPLGIKVVGPSLGTIEEISKEITQVLKTLPETNNVFSDQASQGRYIEITPNRLVAAQFGVSLADLHRTIRLAIGGANISEVIQGHERYPINIRYPQYSRDSLVALQEIVVISENGLQIPLSQLADIEIRRAPVVIKTENARLANWITVTTHHGSASDYIVKAAPLLTKYLDLPPGYSISWEGEYESIQRANNKLKLIIPFTLLITVLLLYLIFKEVQLVAIILVSLPFSLVGGAWFLWLLDFQFSVATSVGFLALLGIATEFSVIMLLYLEQAFKHQVVNNVSDLYDAVIRGALSRLRPKAMTLCVIVFSLSMIMLGSGSGLDVMQRIAAPILGGMLTAPILSLFVLPAIYFRSKSYHLV